MPNGAMPSLKVIRLTIAILMPAGEVSLADTAARLGVKERALQQYLAGLGTSFRDQIAEVRVIRARQLLTKTDMPVSEIASRLGFANARSFRRAFLRKSEIGPDAFRRQYKAAKAKSA